MNTTILLNEVLDKMPESFSTERFKSVLRFNPNYDELNMKSLIHAFLLVNVPYRSSKRMWHKNFKSYTIAISKNNFTNTVVNNNIKDSLEQLEEVAIIEEIDSKESNSKLQTILQYLKEKGYLIFKNI